MRSLDLKLVARRMKLRSWGKGPVQLHVGNRGLHRWGALLGRGTSALVGSAARRDLRDVVGTREGSRLSLTFRR